MTIKKIAKLSKLHPGESFKRPCHGVPYHFHQGLLMEGDPAGRPFHPRHTIEDLTAADWQWVK